MDLRHPIVGRLDLDVESLELPAEPGLHLIVYTAPAGTPTADNPALLASWASPPPPLPFWLPRNGAPGLRSWHDCLPLSIACLGGWCHRLRRHRQTAD
ncbi:hypothetical protein OG217_22355 [Streptomyces sp. NBC_01023]|nr:hypothetical protein OG217_22355 [Streptomyces sp. NBC_01023]